MPFDTLDGLAEIVARRAAELVLGALDERQLVNDHQRRLVDAKTLAELLDVSRDHIYRHATELGAIKTGGALRFDPDLATRRSAGEGSQDNRSPAEQGNHARTARRRRARSGAGAQRVPAAPLLPVGGKRDRQRTEDR